MSGHTPQWTLRIAAAAIALLTLSGSTACDVTRADRQASTATPPNGADPAEARRRLQELTVATAGSMRGYSRERFPHWRRTGENCDVRDSVLKRDGREVGTSGCNVVAGVWISPYDGKTISDPSEVDIDHMVPLANAWRSSAASWTDDKRGDFANDLDDPQLIAVSAASNRSKGDQDPSTWKPRSTDVWCQYAQDWVTVKDRWRLTVTIAEKAALTDMLETCR